MYFIITRPSIDAQNQAAQLSFLKHNILFEPMLEIRQLDIQYHLAQINLEEFDGMIFTSSNGVRAVENLTRLHDKLAFVIGEKTAYLAQSCGFTQVVNTGSNASALCDYLISKKQLEKKRLIYFSGTYVTKDLKAELSNYNYQITQIMCYQSSPVKAFSEQFLAKLSVNFIGAISFYSQLTAESFIKLANESNLLENLKQIEAFALSKKIAESLSQVKWKIIHESKIADETSMVELIRQRYGKEEI